MAESFEIIIDKKGKVTIEGKGFKGKACSGKADEILKALGGIVKTTKKPEYHRGNQGHVSTS